MPDDPITDELVDALTPDIPIGDGSQQPDPAPAPQPSSDDTPPPASGKEGEGAPPDEGKAGEGEGKPKEEGQPPEEGKQTPTVDPDALTKAVGFAETPEQQLEVAERNWKASSKEATRFRAEEIAKNDKLKSQGLEWKKDSAGDFQLVPTKDYQAEHNVNVSFDDLTPEERQLFVDGDSPQKAIDAVLQRVNKTLTRPAPTRDQIVEPISNERKEAAYSYLRDVKTVDGEKRYPEIDELKPQIEALVSNPDTPQWLKDGLSQNPEIAMSLAYDRASSAKARLLASHAKAASAEADKAKNAQNRPDHLSDKGAGSAAVGGSDSSSDADRIAMEIANA